VNTDRWFIEVGKLTINENNERQIVEAARGGDMEAFALLYERYYTAMVWLAYSVLGDHNLAEDAAQQAFVTAWLRIAGLRKANRFGPWLATICRNAAQSIVRDRRRVAALRDNAATKSSFAADSNGFDRTVKDAIDGLAPMYREVIALHYYNRMSYRQIESVLGISEHKVRGRLARARSKIEAYLKKNGFDRK